MPDAWERLAQYASAHHGVISLGAARTLDVSYDELRTVVRSGRLLRRVREVYVVAGSPGTWRQRAMVAVASSSGWASHRTAAALWELDGFPPRQIEVLTEHGTNLRRRQWKVHETRRLRGVDLGEAHGIPCTWVPRTILDLAAVVPPHQVGQALDDACRRWPGTLEVVRQRFLELAGKGRRGTRVIRALLEERLGKGKFTQSSFETSALRLIRSVGLPEPSLQHMVRDGDFRAYLDIAWPRIMLGLECDSLAWHFGKKAHEHDRLRRRRLKALGWDMIEVTYDDVTKRRAETGEQLRELYFARQDTFHRDLVKQR